METSDDVTGVPVDVVNVQLAGMQGNVKAIKKSDIVYYHELQVRHFFILVNRA